jgi:EpsI family protein
VVSAALYARPRTTTFAPKVPLKQSFANIEGWQGDSDIPLDLEIVHALHLDDYQFKTYVKNGDRVSLYIGYYRSGKKIGASHSPLVCFPGQGWQISSPESMHLETAAGTIRLSSMTATKGNHQELLLYWFQAYDRTSRGTLMQKIYNLIAFLNTGKEGNAFVRVSIPIVADGKQEALNRLVDFVKAFYPPFHEYIVS